MSDSPRLDGRRTKKLKSEMQRRAVAVLGGDGRARSVGRVAQALIDVAARIGEEVTVRLDAAPAKQADNFYTEAGVGRDPARPAKVPVAFRLADKAPPGAAPAGTKLIGGSGQPVVFETRADIDLAPGTIAALRGLDADKDAVFLPAPPVTAATLARSPIVLRRIPGGAAAGATSLQIDPAAGLAKDMVLRLGAAELARHHVVTKVEDDLVTIEPALDVTLPEGAPAVEVTDFAPFAPDSRNRQSHALYLGHKSLLNVPSAVSIVVTGTKLPKDAEWSWWGKVAEDSPDDWQPLEPQPGAGSISLPKPAGKPASKQIRGRESLWLRARLPGKSTGAVKATNIRLAIGGKGACAPQLDKRCREYVNEMTAEFEAIANTTPVVRNSAFHPFGREPRLYDSFYVGSEEAFSKAGAQISLCFEFGGPDLGQLAAVSQSAGHQIFGVGTGGTIFRVDLRANPPTLLPLPAPAGQSGPALSQAPLAAWYGSDGKVHVAAAGSTAVHVATMDFASKLDPESVAWTQLPFPSNVSSELLQVAVVEEKSSASPNVFTTFVYALEEFDKVRRAGRLWKWEGIASNAARTDVSTEAVELIQVKGKAAIGWVEFVNAERSQQRVTLLGSDGTKIESGIVDPAVLPTRRRAVWWDGAGNRFLLAGFSGKDEDNAGTLSLTSIATDRVPIVKPEASAENPVPALPITFLPPRQGQTWPQISIADVQPLHFIKAGEKLEPIREPVSIEASNNPARQLLTSGQDDSNRFTVVQRSDSGLLYRRAPAGGAPTEGKIAILRRLLLANAADVPAGADYFGGKSGSKPEVGFEFSNPADGLCERQALTGTIALRLNAGDQLYFREDGTPGRADRYSAQRLVLTPDPPGAAATILLYRTSGTGRIEAGLWRLELDTNNSRWKSTKNLPEPASTEHLEYVLLAEIEPGPLAPVTSALALAEPEEVTSRLGQSSLFTAPTKTHPSHEVTAVEQFGNIRFLFLPHELDANGLLTLYVKPPPWSELGPNQPANPSLSWEYWNGESWWALNPEMLVDGTANFQNRGGIFFTVPDNLGPTDVGGRKNHWIRARLIGGDYGEAKITVTTRDLVKSDGKVSEQVAKRDLSTIRAPFVTALRLGYCAQELVLPEIVLTEDNLGAIDRTSANAARLPVQVFTSLAEMMNPVEPAAAAAGGDDGSCEDPCPEPDPEDSDPCAAPGVHDRCDSPCLPPDNYRPGSGGAAAPGFTRGLMIGFDKPISGNSLSLYVDAERSGPPVELAAQIWRGGRFELVEIVADTSHGLTEPGMLTLAMPRPPDLADLLDLEAHWLRLHPKSGASAWSPRLRGIHLNGVLAWSAETRELERLGVSSGAADQVFRLAETPVEQGSLELRVREMPGEEEAADEALDMIASLAGLPGPWVRWYEREPGATGRAARTFAFDAERGQVRFGDGRSGMIPPLGAELIAVRYTRVTGSSANGGAPGANLQLLSSLAGVDKVIALDAAAGGSDIEAPERARRRAPAKIRHGGRILTLADLEEHAASLDPAIAQVRAAPRDGGIRLVIVTAGAEPRPAPAMLRAWRAAIAAVAGYGIARPGGLALVAPRLLPLAVELELRPASADRFNEATRAAEACLRRLFDPAIGNHDGGGWPLGRLPGAQDLAAALEPVSGLALVERIGLARADREAAEDRSLPETIPADVLVFLAAENISYLRAAEAAA